MPGHAHSRPSPGFVLLISSFIPYNRCVPRFLTFLVGLMLLAAACAVRPVTPAADVTPALLAIEATSSPIAGPAATEIGAQLPAPTALTTALASLSPAAPATAATDAAPVVPDSTPTPVLIVVANVALVPAPTATRPPVVAVARANPAPTAVLPSVVPPPVSGDVAAAEQYTVDLINAQRVARGLAPLAADRTLMSIANGRVADLVARGYTGHNDPSTGVALGPALMRAAGFAGLVGENWYGSRLGPPSIADVAMKWFMTDPPHYENILNTRYDGVGVGIAFNGQQWLLVQDFAGN